MWSIGFLGRSDQTSIWGKAFWHLGRGKRRKVGGKGTKLAPSPWGSLGFTCCCCKLVPTWGGGWVAAAQEGGSGLTICVSVSLLRVVSFIFRARAVCFGRPIITARSKLPFSVNFPDEWQLQGLVAQQMDSHQIVIDGARSDTLFMRGPANSPEHTPHLPDVAMFSKRTSSD